MPFAYRITYTIAFVIILNTLDEMIRSQCELVVLTYRTFKVLVGKDIYECVSMTIVIIDPLMEDISMARWIMMSHWIGYVIRKTK
jgi:hypothetical protein